VGELAALAGGRGRDQGLLLLTPGSAKEHRTPKVAPRAGVAAPNSPQGVAPERIIPLESGDQAFKDF